MFDAAIRHFTKAPTDFACIMHDNTIRMSVTNNFSHIQVQTTCNVSYSKQTLQHSTAQHSTAQRSTTLNRIGMRTG